MSQPQFKIVQLIAGGLLTFFCSMVLAEEALPFSLNAFKDHYQQLTVLEQRAREKASDHNLIWEQSEQLRQQAKKCIQHQEVEINKLSDDLNLLGDQSKGEDQTLKRAKRDLMVQRKADEHLLTSCRLLLVKSEALLRQLKSLQKQAQAETLESRQKTLFALSTSEAMGQLQGYLLQQPIQFHALGIGQLSSVWLLTALVGALLAMLMTPRLRHRIAVQAERYSVSEDSTKVAHRALLRALSEGGIYLLPLLFLLLFWSAVYQITRVWFPEGTILLLVLFYVVLRVAVKSALIPTSDEDYFLPFPRESADGLGRAMLLVAVIGVIWGILIYLPYQQPVPELLIVLIRLSMISTLVFGLIWLLTIVFSLQEKSSFGLLRYLGSLTLLGVIVLELTGYQSLADYILLGMVGTILLAVLGWLITYLLLSLLDGIEAGRYRWQRRFNIGADEVLPGMFWLRLTVVIVVIVVVAVLLLQVWQISIAQQSALVGYFFEGFTIGTMTLVPGRILMAIAVFALMLSAVAWLKRQLESKWLRRSRMDSGARNSIVAITGYLAGAVAILIALSMAGVDFGNLAIIAGALSVGIGFGLQNIINNFVSGLILLFERPIRKGDWIVVNGTEGYVININIRSTLIRTFERADVIVPNSELISGQVTNWVLKDKSGRVKIPVGVAYGSDLQLVKTLLLDIANDRSDVVKDGSVSKPKVLFLSFGDSALLLELRFYISDVDNRMDAISEVNFEIDRLFIEHGIEIPFPQQVIHISESAQNRLETNDS